MDIRSDIVGEDFSIMTAEDIHLFVNIDGNSYVSFVGGGSITIDGEVVNYSFVSLEVAVQS